MSVTVTSNLYALREVHNKSFRNLSALHCRKPSNLDRMQELRVKTPGARLARDLTETPDTHMGLS